MNVRIMRIKSCLNSVNKVLLTVMVPLLCCSRLSLSTGHARIARAKIPFKGNATGGTLVIGYVPNPHAVHFTSASINTSAGESAESVVSRLAQAVVYSEGIFGSTAADPNVELARTALGNTLSIVGTIRHFLLAGTETGLGIPKPPHSLSCSYDKKAGTIEVKWINPPGECQYDSVYLKWRYSDVRWQDTPLEGGGDIITGRPTIYTIRIPAEVAEVGDLDLDIWIKGFRHETPVVESRSPLGKNAIPSNVTAIHMTSNGYCQEETYGIPFTAGIAPNWSAWSTAAKSDEAAFEQGDKYAGVRLWKPVRALLTKPYYQVIKAPAKGNVHGVCRKFLGLTPGHTYRLTACLTTLDMDSLEGDWLLSLCAAPNAADGKDLSVQQLAGLVQLPDGRKGPEAGRIAFYNRDKTTKGNYELVFSDENPNGGSESCHITLPPGADTITVWVRFSCSDPAGKVGFSGVKLEDISAITNVKSWQEIKQQELDEEAQLLKWKERALR